MGGGEAGRGRPGGGLGGATRVYLRVTRAAPGATAGRELDPGSGAQGASGRRTPVHLQGAGVGVCERQAADSPPGTPAPEKEATGRAGEPRLRSGGPEVLGGLGAAVGEGQRGGSWEKPCNWGRFQREQGSDFLLRAGWVTGPKGESPGRDRSGGAHSSGQEGVASWEEGSPLGRGAEGLRRPWSHLRPQLPGESFLQAGSGLGGGFLQTGTPRGAGDAGVGCGCVGSTVTKNPASGVDRGEGGGHRRFRVGLWARTQGIPRCARGRERLSGGWSPPSAPLPQ